MIQIKTVYQDDGDTKAFDTKVNNILETLGKKFMFIQYKNIKWNKKLPEGGTHDTVLFIAHIQWTDEGL